MSELRVIIAGSRGFSDIQLLSRESKKIIEHLCESENFSSVKIISGTARGADKLGEEFAKSQGYHIERFPADWNSLGKRAGYVRNETMAKFASEDGCNGVLIAFWDGESRGTKHMIDLANKYGLFVNIVKSTEE